jgi:protocatechuate 3,4-dioxygenase beta subunit
MRSQNRRGTAAVVTLALAVLGALLWPLAPATRAGATSVESLAAALDGTGHITGRVLDRDGAPLEGATVTVYQWSAGAGDWERVDLDGSIWTDGTGAFRTPGLPAGTYRLGASHYMTDDVAFWDGATTVQEGTDIAVVPGQEVAVGDVTLLAPSTVSGRVLGPSGTPMAEVRVTPYRLQDGEWRGTSDCLDGHGEDTVHTGPDGRYELLGLSPGIYRLEFCSGVAAFEYWDNAASVTAATDVVLGASQAVTGIDARLETGGAITGRVTAPGGQLVPCAEVVAYHQVGGTWRRAPARTGVDSDGTFTLGGLRAGSYRVGAADDGSCADAVEWAPAFSGNAESLESAADIAVTAGATRAGVDLTLQPGGSGPEGRLVGRDGNDALGLVPTLFRKSGDSWSAYRSLAPTTRQGYVVGAVRVGTYRLGFVDPTGHEPTGFWGGDTVEEARSFSVAQGQATERVDIRVGEKFISSEAGPRVIGSALVGGTLTASTGSYSPGGVEVDHAWLADGRPIVGATSTTLVLRPEHVGKALSVQVTASAPGYAALQEVSTATAAVRKRTVAAALTAASRGRTDILAVRTRQPLSAGASVVFYRKDGRRSVRVRSGRLDRTGTLRVSVRDRNVRKRNPYYAKIGATGSTNADTSNTRWLK